MLPKQLSHNSKLQLQKIMKHVAKYKHSFMLGKETNFTESTNWAISVHKNQLSWFFIDWLFCVLSSCVFFSGGSNGSHSSGFNSQSGRELVPGSASTPASSWLHGSQHTSFQCFEVVFEPLSYACFQALITCSKCRISVPCVEHLTAVLLAGERKWKSLIQDSLFQ